MIRCLSEKQLWELYEGEGGSAERAHLEDCEACQWHYHHLVHDLELIGQVLQEPAPQTLDVQPHRALTVRWSPALAVAATLCLAAWGVVHLWTPAQVLLPIVTGPDEKTTEIAKVVTEKIVPALFSTTDVGFGSLPEQATDLDYLQAALDGGWPCERSGNAGGCGTDPFSVLHSEQSKRER